MDFTARLPSSLDQAMTLFTLRRFGASGEFITAANAGDLELRGTVADDKIEALVEALGTLTGAVHAGGRHWALNSGVHEHADIRSAEAHLGGPYTTPGADRSTWSFGGDVADHVVQALYLLDEHVGVKRIQEETERPIAKVMDAMKMLQEAGVVRKFRTPGDHSASGETYGLARTVRDKIDRTIKVDTGTASL